MAGIGHAHLRVLLAEDQADNAESLAHLLRADGHEVHITEDGETTLREALRERPDVIILDIGLPRGDGWAVARQIAAGLADDKPLLVALSGYGSPDDRARSTAAGIDNHLVKPADPEKLLELLRSYRARRRAE